VVEETAVAEETIEQKATETKADGFFVYLGPSIRGVIQNGSVYAGSREEVELFLADAIEKYPLIKRLLSPEETLAQDRERIRIPDNSLSNAYKKLAASIKG
jgi:hypothetical protein